LWSLNVVTIKEIFHTFCRQPVGFCCYGHEFPCTSEGYVPWVTFDIMFCQFCVFVWWDLSCCSCKGAFSY